MSKKIDYTLGFVITRQICKCGAVHIPDGEYNTESCDRCIAMWMFRYGAEEARRFALAYPPTRVIG
jgi:hypothetical protein